MQTDIDLYEHFAAILSYPTRKIYEQVDWLYRHDPNASSEAPGLQRLHEFVKGNGLEAIEELFTLSFDMNPSCCLEVGWHLYGEDYQRGVFLVNMRQSLAEEGLEETHELPDHLSHCLRLLPRLEPEDAEVFACKYLQPALMKILSAIEQDNPYSGVLDLLQQVLEEQYGAADEVSDEDVKAKLIHLPVLNNVLHYDNLEDRTPYKSR